MNQYTNKASEKESQERKRLTQTASLTEYEDKLPKANEGTMEAGSQNLNCGQSHRLAGEPAPSGAVTRIAGGKPSG